jgi:hypothetical protein
MKISLEIINSLCNECKQHLNENFHYLCFSLFKKSSALRFDRAGFLKVATHEGRHIERLKLLKPLPCVRLSTFPHNSRFWLDVDRMTEWLAALIEILSPF